MKTRTHSHHTRMNLRSRNGPPALSRQNLGRQMTGEPSEPSLDQRPALLLSMLPPMPPRPAQSVRKIMVSLQRDPALSCLANVLHAWTCTPSETQSSFNAKPLATLRLMHTAATVTSTSSRLALPTLRNSHRDAVIRYYRSLPASRICRPRSSLDLWPKEKNWRRRTERIAVTLSAQDGSDLSTS